MKKRMFIASAVFAVIAALTLNGCSSNKSQSGSSDSGRADAIEGEQTIKLVFVGDVMLGRGVEEIVESPTYGNFDYSWPFQRIGAYLRDADIAFCNLEGPITDKGEPVWKYVPTDFPAVSMPANIIPKIITDSILVNLRAKPAAINGLLYAGFDIISLANNHIYDFGEEGMLDCIDRLKAAGIRYVGAGYTHEEAYHVEVLEVKGVKIAFLAFTNHGSRESKADQEFTDEYGITWPAASGIAWLNDKQLERGIDRAKQVADIIVVSMHFGMEYTSLPSGPQDKYAHAAIDRGAHLVIGHHPHTVNPTVKYRDRYIAYSLGNFCFDQRENFMAGTTIGYALEVDLNGQGEITEVNQKTVKQTEEIWQMELID